MIVPLLLAAFALLSAQAWANTTDPPNDVGQVLGAALSRGVLTYPLRKGELQTKLAPAYVKNEFDSVEWGNHFYAHMDGWAFTAAATYGLSEHWGVNVLAAYADVGGPHSVNFNSPCPGAGCASPPFSTPKAPGRTAFDGRGAGDGWAAAASLVWDPRSGEGFRFPVFLGLGYWLADESADNQTLGLKVAATLRSPAVLLGLSPAFNVGAFRVVGFVMRFHPLKDTDLTISDYDPATGSVSASKDFSLPGTSYGATGAAGLELTYRPWGLGVTWVPPIFEGATAYSVKWSRRWR